MSIAESDEPTSRKPLRLWPGVVAAVLLLLIRLVVSIFVAEAEIFAVIGSIVGALAILVWWVFFSRATWSDHPDDRRFVRDNVVRVRNGQEMAAFRLSLSPR